MCEYSTVTTGQGSPITAQQMAEHERLVHWVVRRQWLSTLSYQDALHEGRIGLWSALRRYDPQRGTTFSTYAVPAIAHAVWRAVALERHLSDTNDITLSWATDYDALEALDSAQVYAVLRNLTAQLPARLRQIVIAHHGLDGHPPQTFAALGAELGISRQRVHQLHVQAILWLAQPAHSLWLRRLLARNTRRDYQQAAARQRQLARQRRRQREGRS